MKINGQKNNPQPQIDTMGGQAVIEGVLMRSPYGYVIALRQLHDNKILIKATPYIAITKRIKLLRLPFLRGVATLFEMLIIGIKALNFSARQWEASLRILEKQEKGEMTEEDTVKKRKTGERFGSFIMLAAGLALAIFIVVILPNLMTSYIGRLAPQSRSVENIMEQSGSVSTPVKFPPSEKSSLIEEQQPFLYNLIAGLLRAGIIVGYVFIISLLKDIRRIFEYHGAEHKTVYAYEREGEVNVASTQKYSTLHPRCGTSFLAIVIIVSIIIFAVIAQGVALLWQGFTVLPFVVKKSILIGLHILFLPLVAGSAYEIIKLSSRYYEKFWGFRLLALPGLLFQKMTTRQPNTEQLEVAIAALKTALSLKAQKK